MTRAPRFARSSPSMRPAGPPPTMQAAAREVSTTRFPSVIPRDSPPAREDPCHKKLTLSCAGVLHATLLEARAATPGPGTLTPTSGPLPYPAGPFAAANPSAQALGLPDCTAPMSCDIFTLTVDAASVAATREVQVQIRWDVANADFDLYVLDSTGTTLVKSAASSNDPETALFEIPP